MGVKKKPDGLRIRNVNRDVSIKSYVYPKNTEFSETLVRWPFFLPLPILHDFVRFYECKQCWKTDCYQKTLAQMKKSTRRKPPQKTHEIQIVVEFSRWTIKELRGARWRVVVPLALILCRVLWAKLESIGAICMWRLNLLAPALPRYYSIPPVQLMMRTTMMWALIIHFSYTFSGQYWIYLIFSIWSRKSLKDEKENSLNCSFQACCHLQQMQNRFPFWQFQYWLFFFFFFFLSYYWRLGNILIKSRPWMWSWLNVVSFLLRRVLLAIVGESLKMTSIAMWEQLERRE